MKSLLTVFSFALIVFLNVDAARNPFRFENCMKVKSQNIANISRFELSDDPISLSKNLTASVNIELFSDIPENAFVRTKIYKVIIGLFGTHIHLPAPCIAGKGSCTTPYCKFLSRYEKQACLFFPEGVKCSCPIKAGTFGGDNVNVVMPNLGPLIKFLASGNFKLEIQLITKEKHKETMHSCFAFTGAATP